MDISGSVDSLKALRGSSALHFLFDSESSGENFEVEAELKAHHFTHRSITQPNECLCNENSRQCVTQTQQFTGGIREVQALQQAVVKLTALLVCCKIARPRMTATKQRFST